MLPMRESDRPQGEREIWPECVSLTPNASQLTGLLSVKDRGKIVQFRVDQNFKSSDELHYFHQPFLYMHTAQLGTLIH